MCADAVQGDWTRFNFSAFFNVSAGLSRVEIEVSPIAGDPDLYVTLDGSVPTYGAPYYSNSGGVDRVVIRPTDAEFTRSGCAARSGEFGERFPS